MQSSQSWRWDADIALPFTGAVPSVKVPQRSPPSTKVHRTRDLHHGGEGGGDARWRGRFTPSPPNTPDCPPSEYLWQKAARDPNSSIFLKSPVPQMKYSYRKWLLDHFDHNEQLFKMSIKKKVDDKTGTVPEKQHDPATFRVGGGQTQINEVTPSTPEKKKIPIKGSPSSKGKVKDLRRSTDKIVSAVHNLQHSPVPVRGCLKSPNTSKIQKAPRVRFQLEKSRASDSPHLHRISQTDTNLSSTKQVQAKKEIRRRTGGKPVRVHPKLAHSIRSYSHGPGMLSNIPQTSVQKSAKKTGKERPREGSIPERKLSSKGSYLSKEGSLGTETNKSTTSAKLRRGKRKRKSESRIESEVDIPSAYFTPCPLNLKPSDESQSESGSRQNPQEKRRRKEKGTIAEEKNRIHPNKPSEHRLSETSERKVEGVRPGCSHHEVQKEGDKNIPKQIKRVGEVEKPSSRHPRNYLTIRRTSVTVTARPSPHETWRQKRNNKKKDETASKPDTDSSGKSKGSDTKNRKIGGKRESIQKHQDRGTIYNMNRMFYEDGQYDRRALHPLFDMATKQYRPPNHTALRAEERKFSKKVNIIHQLQEQRQMKKKGALRSGFLMPNVTPRTPWK